MQKNKGFGFIGIIIIIALVVGGGAYVANKQKIETEMKADTKVEKNEKISLRSLIGKNVKCTFTRESDGGMDDVEIDNTTKGTVYVSGNNLSGEFVSETKAGNIESHMLKNGEYLYVWSSSLSGQGIKMKADIPMEAKPEDQGAVGWDDKLDYDCEDWSPDSTKFEIPTTIKFTDMSAMMMQASTSIKIKANLGL